MAVLMTAFAVFAAETKFSDLAANRVRLLEVVNVNTSTPTVVGQMVIDSSYKLYIATNTTNVQGWAKVGAQ